MGTELDAKGSDRRFLRLPGRIGAVASAAAIDDLSSVMVLRFNIEHPTTKQSLLLPLNKHI